MRRPQLNTLGQTHLRLLIPSSSREEMSLYTETWLPEELGLCDEDHGDVGGRDVFTDGTTRLITAHRRGECATMESRLEVHVLAGAGRYEFFGRRVNRHDECYTRVNDFLSSWVIDTEDDTVELFKTQIVEMNNDCTKLLLRYNFGRSRTRDRNAWVCIAEAGVHAELWRSLVHTETGDGRALAR